MKNKNYYLNFSLLAFFVVNFVNFCPSLLLIFILHHQGKQACSQFFFGGGGWYEGRGLHFDSIRILIISLMIMPMVRG